MSTHPNLKAAAKLLGALGGAAGKGEAKRRSTSFDTESGRKAVLARWDKAKPHPKK